MSTGFVLWLTGLSCSGKSTLANIVEKELRSRGLKVELLDGDVVRMNLCKGLGFSKEDRNTNILRIGFVSQLLARNDVAVIVAAISPYKETRLKIRQSVERFCEVYVKAPLSVCIERDVKGLYQKALAGEIKNYTGIDDPYEPPDNPEIVIETDKETPEQSGAKIIVRMEHLGLIARQGYYKYEEMCQNDPARPYNHVFVSKYNRDSSSPQD